METTELQHIVFELCAGENDSGYGCGRQPCTDSLLDLLEGFLGGIQGILLCQLLPFAYPMLGYARTPNDLTQVAHSVSR